MPNAEVLAPREQNIQEITCLSNIQHTKLLFNYFIFFHLLCFSCLIIHNLTKEMNLRSFSRMYS